MTTKLQYVLDAVETINAYLDGVEAIVNDDDTFTDEELYIMRAAICGRLNHDIIIFSEQEQEVYNLIEDSIKVRVANMKAMIDSIAADFDLPPEEKEKPKPS